MHRSVPYHTRICQCHGGAIARRLLIVRTPLRTMNTPHHPPPFSSSVCHTSSSTTKRVRWLVLDLFDHQWPAPNLIALRWDGKHKDTDCSRQAIQQRKIYSVGGNQTRIRAPPSTVKGPKKAKQGYEAGPAFGDRSSDRPQKFPCPDPGTGKIAFWFTSAMPAFCRPKSRSPVSTISLALHNTRFRNNSSPSQNTVVDARPAATAFAQTKMLSSIARAIRELRIQRQGPSDSWLSVPPGCRTERGLRGEVEGVLTTNLWARMRPAKGNAGKAHPPTYQMVWVRAGAVD